MGSKTPHLLKSINNNKTWIFCEKLICTVLLMDIETIKHNINKCLWFHKILNKITFSAEESNFITSYFVKYFLHKLSIKTNKQERKELIFTTEKWYQLIWSYFWIKDHRKDLFATRTSKSWCRISNKWLKQLFLQSITTRIYWEILLWVH